MPVYEVTYDLKGAPPEDYTKLKRAIQGLDSYHDQYSSWYVAYEGTDQQLAELLAGYVKKADALRITLVTELTTKYGVGGFAWLRDHGFVQRKEGA